MPIYEYQCDACGERVEVMQKISERPLMQCPACKMSKLRKLVSASAFRLKGSGWYETDFKKGGKKNLSSGADESSADKGDKGEKDADKGKDTDKDKKPAKAEEKTATKEATAETKPAAKEKGKDKGSGKSEAAKAKPSKKADRD